MEFFSFLIFVIYKLLDIFIWLLIVKIIISWLVMFGMFNLSNDILCKITHIIDRIVEPILNPIRNFLPNLAGLDLSPIVLFLLVNLLQQFLIWSLLFLN